MSVRGYLARVARRVEAVAAMEKAAGGVDEATWAMQAVTAYYQQGGTLERLQATMVGDVEAAAMDEAGDTDLSDPCENCGDPHCPGGAAVPLRAGFLNLRVELPFDAVDWVSYPLTESMPDDAVLVADDYDKQLPTHLVRISEVLVRQYHDNGRPTGQWYASAAVTEAANLG